MSMVSWFHRLRGLNACIGFVVSMVSWFHRFRGFMVSCVSWCQWFHGVRFRGVNGFMVS